MNLFSVPAESLEGEFFERLAGNEDVLVERIVSCGQTTPAGEWLVGERDEWVVLLQGEAELSFADGENAALGCGDHVVIAAGLRHRVERTSEHPPCIWLAVHAAGLA